MTAASYLWRIPRQFGEAAVSCVALGSAALLAIAAQVVFRRIVRRGYRLHHGLTLLPSFLQLLIWGLFFAYPCSYNPPDWAWSPSDLSREIPWLAFAGWALVGLGLILGGGAMAWLGLPRSFGKAGQTLEASGPYRITRNPQLVGGVPLIVGYVLLWPSWYALAWLALFAFMAHMMVLSEEEHLLRQYGEEYNRYCSQVPRYLGWPRRS